MTLTEFLLARIAEDEAAGTRLVLREMLSCPVCGESVVDYVTPATINGRDELLSIEGWEYTDAPDAAEATLRDLAAVYADHPDYCEEWRP